MKSYFTLLVLPVLITLPLASTLISTVKAEEQVTVRVGYQPYMTYYNWIWAYEKGWFPPNIKVEFKKYLSGVPQMYDYAAGKIDFAMHGTTPIIISHVQKIADVKIIAVMYIFGLDIIVPPESPIKSVADLKGKTIALRLGTALEIFLDMALVQYGLMPENVTMIDMASAEAKAALIARRVDAAIMDLPFEYPLIKEGYRVIISATDVPGACDPNVISVRTDFAKKHPDVVYTMLDIWFKVADYWYKHPDEAIDWLTERMSKDLGISLKRDFIAWIWGKCSKETLETNLRVWFNHTNPKNLWMVDQRYADILFHLGRIPAPVDVTAFIDDTFIKGLANIKARAENAIKDAEDIINKALEVGAEVTEASKLLNQAKSSFEKGNYESANELALQAKSKAQEAIKQVMVAKTQQVYILIAIIVAIVVVVVIGAYLWKRGKR